MVDPHRKLETAVVSCRHFLNLQSEKLARHSMVSEATDLRSPSRMEAKVSPIAKFGVKSMSQALTTYGSSRAASILPARYAKRCRHRRRRRSWING
jgi:hypothetical protein